MPQPAEDIFVRNGRSGRTNSRSGRGENLSAGSYREQTEPARPRRGGGVRSPVLRVLPPRHRDHPVLATLAIARLVGPAQQGRAAIALVFPVVATIFTFEGFGSALVASQSPTRDDYRTAMTMSLITGLVLAILVAGAAETVGKAVFGVQTANLITLTSPTFVIASTTCVSRAQMMRICHVRRVRGSSQGRRLYRRRSYYTRTLCRLATL